MGKKTIFDQAKERVENSPELQPYRHVVLYDWPEGAEHYKWVASAPASEIISWAQVVDVCARCGQQIDRAALDVTDGDLCADCESEAVE
ncbi:MAG: hypothetical protein JW850_15765 [Thermoflexales bacterium]|nr:hypothetical protein [Thermoflexales bacterium]